MGKITIKAKNLYKIVEENYITKVGGTLTKRAEEINITTTEGSINMHSNTSIDMKAENEIILGDYIEPVFSGMVANDNKVIVKFKPDSYKGEFGFDWCEWDIETGEIEKFQDTKTSDIEYTFDVIEKKYKVATNENRQKKLKLLYAKETIDFAKQYYTAWMSLAKGQKATLKLTTIYLERKQETEDEEYISFMANDDYDISYDGSSNADIKIPLKRDGKEYKIEIFAKNETESSSYIKAIDEKGFVVGIIKVHPNKKIDLDIKIVPVVIKSTDIKEKSEATALYSKAIKAKTTGLGNSLDETLNKHSLNQAGITCTIEDIKTDPEKIVIDPTKDNWDKFYDSTKKEFKDWEFKPTEADASKRPPVWTNEDGDKIYDFKDGKVVDDIKIRLVLDELEEAYYDSYSRSFKGALLFVTEENYYKPDTLGYSQVNPLRSQGTIIFKGGLSLSDAYAHELGHMLGLKHVFLKTGEDIEIENNIILQETNITNYEKNIKNKKESIDYENKRISRETKNMKDYGYNDDGTVSEQSYIDEQQTKISEYQDKIENYNNEIKDFENKIEDFKRKKSIDKGRGFKIKEGTSNNFMDYDISRLYFDKFQCLVMQQEVKAFYNE